MQLEPAAAVAIQCAWRVQIACAERRARGAQVLVQRQQHAAWVRSVVRVRRGAALRLQCNLRCWRARRAASRLRTMVETQALRDATARIRQSARAAAKRHHVQGPRHAAAHSAALHELDGHIEAWSSALQRPGEISTVPPRAPASDSHRYANVSNRAPEHAQRVRAAAKNAGLRSRTEVFEPLHMFFSSSAVKRM